MARQEERKETSLLPWGREFFPRVRSFFPTLWEDMQDELADLATNKSGLSVSEDKKNVYIEAALPGLKSNEIEVNLERGILQIKGEKKEEEEDKEKKYYRKSSNSYFYRVALPSTIDEKQEPKAVYKDGIMKISFTKSQATQGKKITFKNA